MLKNVVHHVIEFFQIKGLGGVNADMNVHHQKNIKVK